MNVKVRPERKSDRKAVEEVNEKAFGQKNEGKLVDALRKKDGFVPELSLVAELDGKVVGHILFFPLPIKDKAGKVVHTTLSLAPVSVLPELQRKGIGSALVRKGLRKGGELGFRSSVVLGHIEYYPRFGFLRADGLGIMPPDDKWRPAFFAMELKKGGLKGVKGVVDFPKEYLEAG